MKMRLISEGTYLVLDGFVVRFLKPGAEDNGVLSVTEGSEK